MSLAREAVTTKHVKGELTISQNTSIQHKTTYGGIGQMRELTKEREDRTINNRTNNTTTPRARGTYTHNTIAQRTRKTCQGRVDAET